MECTRQGGCNTETSCTHCNTCLYKLVKENTPKARWHRLLARLLKYNEAGGCDFSDKCKSCQHKKCSQKGYIDSIINFTPKAKTTEYQHPVYGTITALLKPDGRGKEWRHKFKTLMRYGCCQKCGTTQMLTIDHIKELSKGGSQTGLHNLTVLCYDCNQLKSDPNYKKYKRNNETTN